MNLTAVILAGGQSRRMGRDKAWLEVGGRPLVLRQLATAVKLGASEIFLSGQPSPALAALGWPVLQDLFPRAGPLAGIEQGLRAAATPLVLVLAVDMPALTAACLRHLLRGCAPNLGVVPRVGGKVEPLGAFYPKSAHRLAALMLSDGQRSASAFAEFCVTSGQAVFKDVPSAHEHCFANWNYPVDVALPGRRRTGAAPGAGKHLKQSRSAKPREAATSDCSGVPSDG